MMLRWQWCRLEQLATVQVYALLAAREAVFVVEQACAYQELDGHDLDAWHLVAWTEEGVAACLRVLGPGVLSPEPRIGRVLTAQAWRGQGLGRQLMRRALVCCARVYPGAPLRLSAQEHLAGFYAEFGFVPAAAPHVEDGIPHVEMRRPPGVPEGMA